MMYKDTYSISEFAELIGVTTQTLRNWDKSGKLKPAGITDGGHRLYHFEQALQFKKSNDNRTALIYYCTIDGEDNNIENSMIAINKFLEMIDKEYEILSEQYKSRDDLYEGKVFKEAIRKISMGKISDVILIKDNTFKQDSNELKLFGQILDAMNCKLLVY